MVKMILGALAFVVMYGIVGSMDYKSELQEEKRYCEMVSLWNESGGDIGWPPYKGECDE